VIGRSNEGHKERKMFQIPNDLTELGQWVLWRSETREGRLTKVPYQTNGQLASSTDPTTWASFDKALGAWRREPERFNGVGFVFSAEDPLAGGDLDNCLDDAGQPKKWAQPIIERFADTYIEVSPSGRGLKFWVRGKLPGSGKKVPYHDGAIELYDQARYFTVTGRAFNGAPLQVEEHQADLGWLYSLIVSTNGKPKADRPEAEKVAQGHRHDFLMSLAAQFRARGMERAEILAALRAVNQERCDPTKPDQELEKIVEWISTKPAGAQPGPSGTSSGMPLTEIGNAERLVAKYGTDIRHCHPLRAWLLWDGKRWSTDETAEVERLAKRAVRSLDQDALKIANEEQRKLWIRFAMKSDSDHGIRAMLNRAAAEEGIPVGVADLDQDPFLLNAVNGTINLQTGELLAHRREHYITKLVPVRHDPAARCSRWMQFLAEVFDPHPDIPGFIQRAVGYSLTGDVREECLFLLYGTGRNGKGTLLRTISALLGDYACTADFSTFAGSRDDRGPRDDVANMRGRRFVVSQEAREGAPLAESLVKWLTGGDLVRARNLYERSLEWLPSHKIWLAVNHKPVVRGTDPGIWSRIKLIPFDVSFEGREDRGLKQQILEELPGILAWAVEGCLRWLEEGLEFPESVQRATAEYRAESDQVGRFVDECCVAGEFASIRARGLYGAYRRWAEGTGEQVLTETAFGRRLRDRGFLKEHGRTGTLYRGIGLRADGDGFGDGCDESR